MVNFNAAATDKLNVADQVTFLNFIRKATISKLSSESNYTLIKVKRNPFLPKIKTKTAFNSLEKIIYYLLTDPKKCRQLLKMERMELSDF